MIQVFIRLKLLKNWRIWSGPATSLIMCDMKFKATLWILAFLITWAVCLASCSKRITESNRTKEQTSQSSELKVDLKESSTDKGQTETFIEENIESIRVLEYFGLDTSGKKPVWKETTYSKTDKKSTEKEQKDLTQNKDLQAKEKQKDTTTSIKKDKATERKGMSLGGYIGAGIVLILIAFGLIVYQKIKKARKIKEALLLKGS